MATGYMSVVMSKSKAMTEAVSWACPLDGLLLHPSASGNLRCAQNHHFDKAKAGYVNLLAVQHKRSKMPGDSADMVLARQRFLDAACFQPLAEQLVEVLEPFLVDGALIADAGCGEGYYLQYLQQQLPQTLRFAGWDISRDAIRASCRRSKSINWAVATSVAPPLPAGSVDLLLSLFGFQHFGSFEKVLKKEGLLLLVEAGPGHLLQLRERIYDQLKPRISSSVEKAEAAGFRRVASRQVQFDLPTLNADQLQDLLTMTPHLYRASRERLQSLSDWAQPHISADIVITVLRNA